MWENDYEHQFNDPAKSRKCILSVIPANAGIQCSQEVTNSWTPLFNGVTTFCEIINLKQPKSLNEHASEVSKGGGILGYG